MSAALCIALVLYLVFRSAQARLTRQTVALVEASRRDPLTGLLNHGTAVEQLATSIERLRMDGGGIAVALLDIDNLGNLNDTRGHETGDRAIRIVADLLERQQPRRSDRSLRPGRVPRRGRGRRDRRVRRRAGAASGGPRRHRAAGRRWGAPPAHGQHRGRDLSDPRRIGHGAARQRRSDAARGPVERRGRAPLGGRRDRGRPERADLRCPPGPRPRGRREGSLHEAALGGCGAVCAVHRRADRPARRGAPLAAHRGPAPRCRQDRHPGPDPAQAGRLTVEEFEIVKQHVALGDMIVRDLPDVELIRAASVITTSAGTATATCTGWPVTRSRSRPDPRRRRHVLGDDDEPTVPQGAVDGGGAPPAGGCGGHAARRAAGGGVHRGHRDTSASAAPR